MLQPKGAVAHDHQIEHPEVTSGREQVSAGVVSRRPSTTVAGTGRGCRLIRRSGRTGMVSPSRAATKIGCGTFSGSHHPNCSGRREVGERRARRQQQTPRRQVPAAGPRRGRHVQAAGQSRPAGLATPLAQHWCRHTQESADERRFVPRRSTPVDHAVRPPPGPATVGVEPVRRAKPAPTQQLRRNWGVSPPESIALDTNCAGGQGTRGTGGGAAAAAACLVPGGAGGQDRAGGAERGRQDHADARSWRGRRSRRPGR